MREDEENTKSGSRSRSRSSSDPFERTALQLRVHMDMTEIAELSVPSRDLAERVLLEKIDAQIGGRCHENRYVRKGKQFFELLHYSLPEMDGAELVFTAQFLCDTFQPRTSARAPRVFQMRVEQVVPLTSLSSSPMLECSWPDPETGEVAMRAYVAESTTSSFSPGDVVRVAIGDVKAEVGEHFLKAMGKLDSGFD